MQISSDALIRNGVLLGDGCSGGGVGGGGGQCHGQCRTGEGAECTHDAEICLVMPRKKEAKTKCYE